MKLKNLWLLVICLGLLFVPSCNGCGKTEDPETNELEELLKDQVTPLLKESKTWMDQLLTEFLGTTICAVKKNGKTFS